MALRDIEKKYTLKGTTVDLALIIPILNSDLKIDGINSIDFCIGAFKPVLWTPTQGEWHPTYSFDLKFTL